MGGFGSIYSQTRTALRVQAEALARLQETVASGRRVNRPSDAPADAFRMLGLNSEAHSINTYTRNLDTVTGSLEMASSLMQQFSDVVARAKTLATQGASGTYGPQGRQAIAAEINEIANQALSLVNTRYAGRYLFGGSSNQVPYVAQYEDGSITRVDYRGNFETLDVQVAPGVNHSPVVVGEGVFRSNARQEPVFAGDTGAQAGAATSNISGAVRLDVTHDTTTYLGASGVAAGDSSASGDTLLGNGHTLTIDEPNQTLQLDTGAVVAFTPGDTNVAVQNAEGDVVYVNVAAIVGGFQGTVGIQATGNLSIDGGVGTAAIDFADANQAVVHAETGRVLYVDSTGIQRTGVESVSATGAYDLFEALIVLRDALLDEPGISASQKDAMLSEGMTALNSASDGLMRGFASVGARLAGMESLKGTLEDLAGYNLQETARLGDADIVQVAADLARWQTLYQMTLISSAKLLSLSLLDFI